MARITPSFGKFNTLQIPGGPARVIPGSPGLQTKSPGILSRLGGAAQGVAGALSRQKLDTAALEQSKAQTDIAKAQLPGVEAQSEQQKLRLGQLEKQKNVQDKLDAAALEGTDSYLSALKSLDPDRAQVYRLKNKQLEAAQVSIARAKTSNKKEQLELQKQSALQLGGLAIAIKSFGVPKMQQEAYTRMLPEIRKILPSAPKEFDPLTLKLWVAQATSFAKKGAAVSPEGKLKQDIEQGFLTPEEGRKAIDAKLGDSLATAQKTKFSNSSVLRKEFTSITTDFVKVRDAFRRVEASTRDPSPAGDLSLIFNFMKILDPGSVVRESEFANAAATGSLGERFKAAGQRLTSGERLSPAMRADFVSQANNLMKSQQKGFDRVKKQFTAIANRNDLDPRDVITELDLTPSEKGLPETTDDLQRQADEAIAQGADPAIVQQRLDELRGQRGL